MSSARFRTVAAVHLLLMRGDSVLLLRRANTGYEDGNYSVPAGHVEGGETARAACVREAAEEVGVFIEVADLCFALVLHRRAEEERIDFFFSAERWQGDPANCETGKCDELRWASVSGLPGNTVPYVRAAIEMWRRGERYGEFGWR